jgi:hypothetical protein
VPKGFEWHLYPPHCGTLLGPWTFWNMWKCNCHCTHKGGFCSRVCWTKASLGGLRAEYTENIQCCLVNQRTTPWQGLTRTQRQAWESILGSRPAAKTRLLFFNRTEFNRLLFFNRTEFRVVTGLLTEHNTLRRHFYIMGLIDSPLCRRCRAQDETSAQVSCECKALVILRHTYLVNFFLDPKYVRNLSVGEIWNLIKGTGLP